MFLSRKGIHNNPFLCQGMIIDAIGAGYALAVMVHTMIDVLTRSFTLSENYLKLKPCIINVINVLIQKRYPQQYLPQSRNGH